MYPHRIRLRGPWEYQPLARCVGDDRPLPPPGRMTLPAHWSAGGLFDFAGTVQFRRRFGYPGRIDAHERVFLTFAGHRGLATAYLNGFLLADPLPSEPCEFEVLHHLQARNELRIDLQGDATAGLTGEVALEIRCQAFLRRLALHRNGANWCLSGEVVGQSQGPLELYLVVDRHTVAYQPIVPTPQGQPFALAFPTTGMDGEPARMLQLDLVAAAVVWYTTQMELPELSTDSDVP